MTATVNLDGVQLLPCIWPCFGMLGATYDVYILFLKHWFLSLIQSILPGRPERSYTTYFRRRLKSPMRGYEQMLKWWI